MHTPQLQLSARYRCMAIHTFSFLFFTVAQTYADPTIPLSKGSKKSPTPDQGSVTPDGTFIRNKPIPKHEGPEPTREEAEKALGAIPNIKKIDEQTYMVDSVKIDTEKRTISFAAKLNMKEDVIEYALVSDYGKIHESLFATSTKPSSIHVAALLLKMKSVSPEIDKDGKVTLPPSSAVTITVSWKKHGPDASYALEDLLSVVPINENQDNPGDTPNLKKGPWYYSGSRFHFSSFEAEIDGSVISTAQDRTALIINPRARSGRNFSLSPKTELLPAINTPVSITITLPKS